MLLLGGSPTGAYLGDPHVPSHLVGLLDALDVGQDDHDFAACVKKQQRQRHGARMYELWSICSPWSRSLQS